MWPISTRVNKPENDDSALRERIYVDPEGGRFGLLLYTASPDAEGTLGGLVGQARNIETHLAVALRTGRPVRLRIAAAALRSVEHRGGIDAFLLKAKDVELSIGARALKREIAKKQAAPAA